MVRGRWPVDGRGLGERHDQQGRFDPGQPELVKLRPGLSAKVTVELEGD